MYDTDGSMGDVGILAYLAKGKETFGMVQVYMPETDGALSINF